jgi:parallel beta-helix repeat protein
MKKTLIVVAFFSLLLVSVAVGVQLVRFAAANFIPTSTPLPAIFIRGDGSVDPSNAAIQRVGNVYTFTGDIRGYTLAVQCDNVVVDGADQALIGNGNYAGIFVQERNNVTVTNVEFSNFTVGILCAWENYGWPVTARSNTFSGNTIANCTYGILIRDFSSDNIVSANTLENNTYGVYLDITGGNVLRDNRMNGNRYNFYVDKWSGLNNDVDVSNTVDGKPIYYWINQQNRLVPSDAGYVALVNCTGIAIKNLNLSNNGEAILLASTTNSAIAANTIAANYIGIVLVDSSNNTVCANSITGNSGGGISADKSSNNTVFKNSLADNGDGITFSYDSYDNVFGNNITTCSGNGIIVEDSFNINVEENSITGNNGNGIDCPGSHNCNLVKNNVTANNGMGIHLQSGSLDSALNIVAGNYVAYNSAGLVLDDSSQNTIRGNMVTENNGWGIRVTSSELPIINYDVGSPPILWSTDNLIYLNNFADNKVGQDLQVSIPGIWSVRGWVAGLGNVWDNGSAGNYWSDYLERYANASAVGNSETGDTPYVINPNNVDNHPLMLLVNISSLPAEPSSSSQTPSPSPSLSQSQPVLNLPAEVVLVTAAVIVMVVALAASVLKKRAR